MSFDRKKYQQEWYKKNKHRLKRPSPEERWTRELKYKFGITSEEYNEKLVSQNYVCAICEQPETSYDSRWKKVIKLAVDHCHNTGEIRSLLCRNCNTALGVYEKNKTSFEKYLLEKTWQKIQT